MANKKNQRRKKQNKASSAARSANVTNQRQDDAMRIAGIAVFAFSVIFFCLAVITGDGVWSVLHNVYVGIFGMFAACVFPLISIVVMLFYSFNKSTPSRLAVKSVETVIMVLLIASFVHILEHSTGEDFATVNPYLGSDGVKPFLKVCKEEKKGTA